MHIQCQRCAARLTPDLEFVDPAVRNDKMGEQMLKRGTITAEDGTYFQDTAGVYLVNPDDTMNMLLTSEARRLNGCCGLDGCDGPNLLCEGCQTYVATKMTDCWMPHCVVFDPTAATAQA